MANLERSETVIQFLVTNNGDLFRQDIRTSRAGNIMQVLAENARLAPIRLPAILPNVDVFVKGRYFIFCKELRELRFTTAFALASPTVISPRFADNNDTLRMSLPWVPPADMKLFMVGHVADRSSHGHYNIYLLAVNVPDITNPRALKECKGLSLLPLPNQYDDGKMCLGEETSPASNSHNPLRADSWSDCASRVETRLREAPWFADTLFTSYPWKAANAPHLFKWANVEGFPQLDYYKEAYAEGGIQKHWTGLTQATSIPLVNDLMTLKISELWAGQPDEVAEEEEGDEKEEGIF